ncbi:CCN family member 3 isoform X1 [Amia ocellicauda]|uniref:CCN family member 3 isoform X1 n=1 Tax=Amia ocellicauda TaxID=2972642 RepID=UPI0034640B59
MQTLKTVGRLSVLCVLAQMCSLARSCPSQCHCTEEAPLCAPGVQLVLDDCACCLVCARQKGQPCSERNPCDSRKGLHCDYTADADLKTGVCMAREGDICVFDGSVYQNGEIFFPSCKYQCACRDGQIGCVPRCNLDVLLPGPDCPFPRKVQVPGECCEKWVCNPRAETPLGGFAMAAYREEETVGVGANLLDPSVNCIEQTTEWGACSRSCGLGVSTRVTNCNRHCEMVKQNRLCIVRPCGQQHRNPSKKGKKCMRTTKTVIPTHFTFKNCTSIQAYRPRFCGVCRDGRCCTPHSTKTVQVEFRCPQGKVIKKPMMFINTCACHSHCPRDNAVYHTSDPMFSGLKI